MRPIILINDPTASGGTVIQGSDTTTINGRAVAREGDAVVCLHGICAIATGDDTTIVDGAAVARDGDLTACGSPLIATNSNTGIL